jgi:acyl phosphate:glycerol-3-phosphate acyltransferase
MTHILIVILFLAGAFLWGGIPTGYIVVKQIKGIDIRNHGSGNIGATNVRRVLGMRWFCGVLFLDALKGAFPLIVLSLLPGFSGTEPVLVAAGTIGGNLFSPWLGFKGGKGIGTSLGALSILAPIPLLAAILVFALSLCVSNYISLSSILAAVVFPIALFSVESFRGIPHDKARFIFAIALAIAIIALHRGNIAKLVHGTENKFLTYRDGPR